MMPKRNGFRPPAPGDKVLFVCKKCGHRFMATIPILPFPVKCPECGSHTTECDKQVSY
jgi:predicted Zn-ribbon and HTH transcriptional regulator